MRGETVRGGNAFSGQEISQGRRQVDAGWIKGCDAIKAVFQGCPSDSIELLRNKLSNHFIVCA